MSQSDVKKSIPVLNRDVVNSLDNLHRAILEVMAEDKKIIITEAIP
jgi:hypothetical protein